MSELDKLVFVGAAIMTLVYLIGPAALWGIPKTLAELLLVALLLIWML